MKKELFYVDTGMGCALYRAGSIEAARKAALDDVGRMNFKSVRPATDEDEGWVTAMGGAVHEVGR